MTSLPLPEPITFRRRWSFRLAPALVVGVLGWVAMWQALEVAGAVGASASGQWPVAVGVTAAVVAYAVLTVRVAFPQELHVSTLGLRLVARGQSWSLPWDDVQRLGVPREGDAVLKILPSPGARLPRGLARLSSYPRWEAGRGIVTFVPARGWNVPDDVVLATVRAYAGGRWRE